jgi:hypothetical protein
MRFGEIRQNVALRPRKLNICALHWRLGRSSDVLRLMNAFGAARISRKTTDSYPMALQKSQVSPAIKATIAENVALHFAESHHWPQ